MKVISLIQPWASLVVKGFKNVENRSWQTWVRGEIGIAASARKSEDEWINAVMTIKHIYRHDYYEFAESRLIGMVGEFDDLPRGAILGTAEIAACQRERTSPWHFDGNWGFYLENAQEFKEPIPAKGKLGFWDFDIPKDSPKIHPLVQRKIDKLNAGMEDCEKGGAK